VRPLRAVDSFHRDFVDLYNVCSVSRYAIATARALISRLINQIVERTGVFQLFLRFGISCRQYRLSIDEFY